jgi:hypothetical protein
MRLKTVKHIVVVVVVLYVSEQGFAEKESRKRYLVEKSHDFHGKLDFKNFGKSKI